MKDKIQLNPCVSLKPPIGVIPTRVWKSKRLTELQEAIKRYSTTLLKIPEEWVAEYNTLLEEF